MNGLAAWSGSFGAGVPGLAADFGDPAVDADLRPQRRHPSTLLVELRRQARCILRSLGKGRPSKIRLSQWALTPSHSAGERTVQATIGMPSARYSSARLLGSMSMPRARKCGRAIATCSSCGVGPAQLRRHAALPVAEAVEPAQDVRVPLGEPGVGIGIEADHRGRAVVVDQHLVHPLLQRPDRAVGGLDLDQHHRPMARPGSGCRPGSARSPRCPRGASRRGRRRYGRRAGPAGRSSAPGRRRGTRSPRRRSSAARPVRCRSRPRRRLRRRPGSSPAHRPATTGRDGRSAGRTACSQARPKRVFHAASTTASTSTAKFIGRR